ncbi:unnamed protein product, partial [marine sediment metagenome]
MGIFSGFWEIRIASGVIIDPPQALLVWGGIRTNNPDRDIPFQSDFEFLSYLDALTDSSNILYFNGGSKLKKRGEMATEVA